ncbi:hypothetical protein [Schlesneria paludicola]|uniref:hypothetical protein n=1 Tax=Schlesneria paludicola TaxID=360056 RepID=UPI000299DC5A|nr:hypothetical protein [Schlesneria paludicola]
MSATANETDQLATRILNRVEELILTAERETKPLEIDPFRSELFTLFVTANGAGYTREDADPDLSADGLCRALGARWELANAAKSAMESTGRMSADQMSRMRLLWSVMRMWMEWSYAWDRWAEFHQETP